MIYERYNSLLIEWAEPRIRPIQAEADEGADGVANGVLYSFITRARHGAFPQLVDHEDVERILRRILRCKIVDLKKRSQRQRRRVPDANKLLSLLADSKSRSGSVLTSFEEIHSAMGSLDETQQTIVVLMLAAEVGADEINRLMRPLSHAVRIALSKLNDESCTNWKIAEALGCSPATVGRHLRSIRMTLRKLGLCYYRRQGETLASRGYPERFPEHEATIDPDVVENQATNASRLAPHEEAGQPRLGFIQYGCKTTRPLEDHAAGTVCSVLGRHDSGGSTGKYQHLGVIARGGMGWVVKAFDRVLHRVVAMKILLDEHRGDPEIVRRFFQEAQIGYHLPHPGIASVYEMGTDADGRHYFTMRLVQGRTLTRLLHDHSDRVRDQPLFLAIFEAVCQTLAYAHARGVVHRDLKPANVMFGGFGEVQVLDWGLAKVRSPAGLGDVPKDQSDQKRSSVHRLRGGFDVEASQAGMVLGTSAYMSPEQASGQVQAIDERADIFGLGSILCEILTGSPAYIGISGEEVLGKAIRADLADAYARLDCCGAHADLVCLARDCLAAELERRPRTAAEVALRISAYRTRLREQPQAAQLARVTAQPRDENPPGEAPIERSGRWRSVALAASVLGWASARMLTEVLERADCPLPGMSSDAVEQLRPKGTPALTAGLVGYLSPARHTCRFGDYVGMVHRFPAAFGERPTLAADFTSGSRYLAACCDALAAATRTVEEPSLPENDRARMRHQSPKSIRANSEHWQPRAQNTIDSLGNPTARILRFWTAEPALLSFRNDGALASLPDDFARAFRALWTEVDRLIEATE